MNTVSFGKMSNIDWNKVRENLWYAYSRVKDFFTWVLINICFYAPVAKLAVTEFFTFRIPILDHYHPVQIGEKNMFVSTTNYGEVGRRCLMVFFKYYSPHDVSELNRIMVKYLGNVYHTDQLNFEYYLYLSRHTSGHGAVHRVSMNPASGTIVRDSQTIPTKLGNVSLNDLVYYSSEEKKTPTASEASRNLE